MKQSEYRRLRNILIELGGTTALVYFTNWANVLYELEQIKLSSLALVYGLMVSVLIYVAQDKSGAHFDPSVTVAGSDAAQLSFLQPHRLLGGHPLHLGPDRRRRDRRLRNRQAPDAESAREAGVDSPHPARSARSASPRLKTRRRRRRPSAWKPSRSCSSRSCASRS